MLKIDETKNSSNKVRVCIIARELIKLKELKCIRICPMNMVFIESRRWKLIVSLKIGLDTPFSRCESHILVS